MRQLRSQLRALGALLGRVSALVAVFAWASPAFANDTAFAGNGAGLVPLKESRVRMLSEEITLTAHTTKWRWDIEARYVFENQASTPVALQVGFPELRCEGGEGARDERCTSTAFRTLKTLVDGKPVEHRAGSLSDAHEWRDYLGVIWLFDVTFPAKKQVRITHSYSIGGSVNSMFDRSITYVTRTGVGWAGSIGRARFTARFPPFTHSIRNVAVQGLMTRPPRVTSNGVVELVVEGTEWTPTSDVEFEFNDAFEPQRAPCRSASFEPGQRTAARDCINALYAAKGYPFKSPELHKQFYSGDPAFRDTGDGQEWARPAVPLRGFNSSWFTEEDLRLIALWQQVARQDPASRGSAAAAEPLPDPNPVGDTGEPLPGPDAATPERSPRPAVSSSTAKPAPSTAGPTHVARSCRCQLPGAPRARAWSALALCTLGLAIRRWRRCCSNRSVASGIGRECGNGHRRTGPRAR